MKRWIVYLLAIIILVATGGGIYAVRYMNGEEVEPDIVVESGDTVSVHYTGWLEDPRIYDERRIFDTSRSQITGETTYTFTDRPRGDPFSFTVNEGEVIPGWEENVLGMKEGESRTVMIPPEKAYDTHSEDLIFEIDKEEVVPVYERMNVFRFQEIYEQEPEPSMSVENVFWGWDMNVESIEGNYVWLRNVPDSGETYNSYRPDGRGWTSKVISIDSSAADGIGEIVIEHSVRKGTVVSADLLALYEDRFAEIEDIRRNAGQSPQAEGIVVEVGEDTITVDFNEEVAGKTLRFRITVLEIERG